jgi:ligand-binding sensor domain-containing protein
MPHSADYPPYNEAILNLGIMKQGFIVACLLLMYLCGHAQYDHLKFKHYTTDNGLSQGSIYHIYQDRKGFIWLATWDGLNRFDGYQFTVFKPNLHDSNSIKGSRISSILEDESSYIWVGTYEALNRYDPSTHQFKQFYVKDEYGKNLEARYNPFYR